jgi:hypothetical protein
VTAEEDRPSENHDASVFRHRKALDQVVGGKGPEEIAKI